jgi:hypothetical protein
MPHGEASPVLREDGLRSGTPFPHDDIPDEGPPLLAALCASGRDEPTYRHRSDHGPDGLLLGGPKGESNPLQRMQGFTFCTLTAATPDAERKQRVTYKGRESERHRANDPEWQPVNRFAYVGGFIGARKPANSGRKRKAA